MASQRWHAAPGQLLNRPHSFWPISSGGVQTHILCVLTNHSEWRSCSHEREVANWRRNVIGSELRQWQPGEHIDKGRHARYSHAHCRRLLLESHRSQKRLECHVARKPVKVPAEELGWSLARQEVAYPDRPMTNIQFEMPSQGACRILHHIRWQHRLIWVELLVVYHSTCFSEKQAGTPNMSKNHKGYSARR